ncbi:Uncharacterised protein [uncultured archaeon]|nr:Uncharacterised protein [uncultured archaeon]
MDRNDFFLDTGIIFGQFDPKDPYFEGSKNHLDKYSYIDHNYYAVKRITLKEVDNVSRRKIRERPIRRQFRQAIGLKAASIKIKVENLFSNNIVKDIDYDGTHASFNELYRILFGFLENHKKDNNPKDRDAKILANVFIWDKEIHELHNPHLVTIDRGDIVNNREGLKNEANKCLSCISRLEFCLIQRKHVS